MMGEVGGRSCWELHVIVVDVGNSSLSIARFTAELPAAELPAPDQYLHCDKDQIDWVRVETWLDPSPHRWILGSVSNRNASAVVDWIKTHRYHDSVRFVTWQDLPIQVLVDTPDQVGIDRLAAAAAANHVRTPDRAAIVVDIGTAITIDMVSPTGAFQGGMIIPGMQLCLDAMAQGTERLPVLRFQEQAPPLIGKNTQMAMQAGVFWSVVSQIDGITRRLRQQSGDCDIFLTGGYVERFLPYLDSEIRHEPHLVMAGLALVTS